MSDLNQVSGTRSELRLARHLPVPTERLWRSLRGELFFAISGKFAPVGLVMAQEDERSTLIRYRDILALAAWFTRAIWESVSRPPGIFPGGWRTLHVLLVL
jgi:hypothetical protein